MNILLLYPQRDDNKKSLLERLSITFSKPEKDNINLVEITNYLPLVWEERLLDLNVSKLNESHIKWADYVVICAEKKQFESTIETIHKCKSLDKKLVLCGDAVQESDSAYLLIDHFVSNAAGFEAFSNDLADNTLQKTYQAIFPKTQDLPFQAYSLWGIISKISRAVQPFPA